jgi:hypothetical protein
MRLVRGRAFKDVAPAFIDGGVVALVFVKQLVFKPAVDTHIPIRFRRHGGGWLSIDL